MDCVLVRYGEIALKGANRASFESRLADNIKRQLKANGMESCLVKRTSGRLIVDTCDPAAAEAIARVFGVTSASPSEKIGSGIDSMAQWAIDAVAKRKPAPKSFRISVNRLMKGPGPTSQELNTAVGALVQAATKLKVSLGAPELEVSFDLAKGDAYAHTSRVKGVLGLPVGVSGKAVVLMSGGIDSPVAAWLCMRRGLEVTLLHFQHEDHVREAPEKIIRLADALRRYHPKIQLVCIPVAAIERQIISKVEAKYRIVVLRRLFMRMATRFCEEYGYKAIASGDNLGQVASQTLENLSSTSKGAGVLWMRPLEFFEKQETIDLGRRIGTLETSCEDYSDCCSFLVAKHPVTRGDASVVDRLEARIGKEFLDEAFKQAF